MKEQRHTCLRCGSRRAVLLSTCPGDIECPVCKAGPGKPCLASRGHVAYFMHGARILAAEEFDKTRGTT